MAVTAELTCTLSVRETLVTGVDAAGSPVITHGTNSFKTSETLTSSSTPPVTKYYAATVALVAGAKTLTLTSLTGANGTVDMTGLKIQVFKIRNNSATNTLNVAEGASNGYPLFGASNDVTLPANGELMFFAHDGSADVAAGDATIDFAGTTTETFNVEILAG